jgi:thimet oligopeptidase
MRRVLLGFAAAAALSGCQTVPATPVEPVAVAIPAFDPVAAEAEAFLGKANLTPAAPAEVTAACDDFHGRATALRTRLETETGPATIGQTFRRYDALSSLVYAGGSEAYLVSQVHPDKEIRTAAEACVERMDALATQISLSRPIYERLKAIDPSAADERTRFALTEQLADYRRAGVDKDDATRAKIEALQNEITTIGLTFNRNIREGRREITVKSADELAGLPADYIERHKPAADGLIHITTEYPDYQPVMTYAHSEDLRRRLSAVYDDRAWPANEAVLRQLLEKRYELATTLGYDSWARLVTEDKMIQTPEKAQAFIDEIAVASEVAADRDYNRLLGRLKKIDPKATDVPRWSSNYLSQLIRKEEYDVDPQLVRQYFAFNNVQAGIFQLTEDLFSVDIRPWSGAPVWHESVEAYELYDGDQLIGRFYLDMHPRDGKYSHAAHFQTRIGLADRVLPVGALVTNFPAGDHATGLMEHSQVETFLHEFGHLLHNLFSGRQDWGLQTYNAVERDFIEAPSQLLEEWVWDYETLKPFAVNAKGETIPADLVRKMNAARWFGEALGDRTQLGYSAVSLNYYNRPPSAVDLHGLYEAQYEKYAPYDLPKTSHPYAAFGHLDGYSAVYYTYTWSKAIGADLFTPFEGNLRDTATARRYRDVVLAQGGSKPAAVLVQEFLGRPWSLDAYRKDLLEN